MTLREAAAAAKQQLGVPLLRRLQAPQLQRVHNQVAERMDNLGSLGPGFDRKALLQKAQEAHRTGDWTKLTLLELARITWVLWEASSPLECDEDFLEEYLRIIRHRGKFRPHRYLISAYLRRFDDSRYIAIIGRFLSEALQQSELPQSMRQWKKRHDRYRLFDPLQATDTLAEIILESGRREEVLNEAGIHGEALTSGIGAAIFRTTCVSVKDSLDEHANLEKIKLLTLWACDSNGRIRYRNERARLANALLLPWSDDDPPATVRGHLEQFFDRAYGDPRFRFERVQWAGTSEQAKQVRIRWIAEQDLEFFFSVVKGTTDRPDQWEYRRCFWKAYIDKRVTKGTWMALGNYAAGIAQSDATQETPQHGRLTGASASHSLLLLRIGNLVIAEWSHNGKLRIWLDGNQHAPQLYQRQNRPYQRYSLMQGEDFDQAHWPVEGWNNWQGKTHEFIRRQTGIEIPADDYMPGHRP